MERKNSEWKANSFQSTNQEERKNTMAQELYPTKIEQIEYNLFRQKQFIELQHKLEQLQCKLTEKTNNNEALEVQFENTKNQLSQQINWAQNLEQQLEESQIKLNQKIEQKIAKKNEQINTLEQQIAQQKEDLKLLGKQNTEQKSVIRQLNKQLTEQTSLVTQQSETSQSRNWIILLLSLLLTIAMV